MIAIRSILFAALLAAPTVAFAQGLGVSGQIDLVGETSAKEKRDNAASAVQEMGDIERAVQKLMDQVVKEGDADKISCVRSKLTSIKTLGRVASKAKSDMEMLLASSDPAEVKQAEFKYRSVVVSLSKIRQFQVEAEACLGEGSEGTGGAEVEVTNAVTDGVDETSPPDIDTPGDDSDPTQGSPWE